MIENKIYQLSEDSDQKFSREYSQNKIVTEWEELYWKHTIIFLKLYITVKIRTKLNTKLHSQELILLYGKSNNVSKNLLKNN